MESIISPWFIYLLGIINSIEGVCIIFTILISIFLVGVLCHAACVVFDEYSSEEDKKAAEAFRKRAHVKFFSIVLIFLILINTFIPSKQTLIAIYIANKVTVDMINEAKVDLNTFRTTIKQDIIDIMDAVEEQGETKKK
jgi:heme/copper-type cytochrome/quinol oxidase subunit 2